MHMKHFTENELKILIPEEIYCVLYRQALIQDGKTVLQTNHYFDTPCFYLAREKIALRIREKNKQFEVTLKIGRKKDNQSLTSEEYNQPLTPDQALSVLEGRCSIQSIIPQIKALTGIPENRSLILMGCMNTLRTVFTPVYGLNPLELDRNSYLGIQDFELEWEYDYAEQYPILIEWLVDRNIRPNLFESRSKFGRFMERLVALKEHPLPL